MGDTAKLSERSLFGVLPGGAPTRSQRPLWTDSRHLGLALGIVVGKYLLKTNHLHYGYWPKDLPVKVRSLAAAQQALADVIVGHIPDGASSILDVGCGAGGLAAQLVSRGHSVDCVCPCPVLVRYAQRLLQGRSVVFQSTFEEFQTDRSYDVVLFSESFQYVRMHRALDNVLRLTKPGGFLLVCDFFKTDAPGQCLMGGGQKLADFYGLIGRYPLKQIRNLDITAETAATIDLVNGLLTSLAPWWRIARWLLRTGSFLASGAAREKFGVKLDKVQRKYFSGLRTGQHFATYKSYRLLLYQVITS